MNDKQLQICETIIKHLPQFISDFDVMKELAYKCGLWQYNDDEEIYEVADRIDEFFNELKLLNKENNNESNK